MPSIFIDAFFESFIKYVCLSLLVFLSPIIIIFYSAFSSYPFLLSVNKFFRNMNDINAFFFEAFLYIFITLRFIINAIQHIIFKRRNVSRPVANYLTSYIFLLEVCLIINPFIEYYLLKLCGDIETNPGPYNETAENISICHWNLNGIAAHNYIKHSMLEAYNALYSYDLICISETFLDSSHSDDDHILNMQGYNLIRADHPDNTKRGGVCIYYKEHLPLKVRNDISPLKECVVVEIKANKQKCLVACLYRSPSQTNDEFDIFCDGLEATFSNLNLESPFCSIVLGDFNAKCNKWWFGDTNDHCGLELDSLSSLSGFSQLIKEPTNFEPNKRQTCIDLIFTSQPNLVSDSGVHTSLYQTCHHQIIHAKIDLKVYLPPPYEREVWSYGRADVDQINRAISSFDWDNVLPPLGINEQVELFNTTLLNIFRNFIPHKLIKCSYKDNPWINSEIKSSLRKKNRLYKRYIANGCSAEDLISLNNQSLYCSDLISSSKKRHFNILATKLNDPLLGPKTYWSILNGFLGKAKIPTIPPLLVTDSFETNFLTKANIFNDHFSNQCNVFNNGSTLPDFSYKNNSRIDNVIINSNSIIKIIKDLNPTKAHGWDGISIKMIKICGESIIPPLMIIFNNSLLTGAFPENWKRGNIVPVHKKESKNLAKNYRPISLLPICGKIFEKLIYNSLFEYLKANDILVKNQSGFISGDSCISQLLCITHDIYKAFDGNPSLEVRGIFLDISKAFDRVWHEGLLFKLKRIGIDGQLYMLLKNYLTNRKQRVVLNGKSSSWAHIKAGVPQGSVLGPLLFLIYINDLPDGLKCNAKLFADDTSIFSIVTDINESCHELNNDLLKINNWAHQWKMSFNPDPNKQAAEVIFSHKLNQPVQPPVYFNNSPVASQSFTKHLGMILDSKLNFNQHLSEKISKTNRGIGLIKRLRYDLSRKTLITVYKSHIRPHLDYGDIIYDRPNVENFVNRIESVQYNAALAITGAIRGTSRERIYEELGFESLAKRRWYRRLCAFWKIVKGLSPKYLKNILPPIQPSRNPTRQNLFITFTRKTDYFANSFFPFSVNQWNNLDPVIKDLKTISSFKNALLKFIRPHPAQVYYVNDFVGLKLLTRLRLNLSHLNEHKFRHSFHDTVNPLCSCSLETESVTHFLLHCHFYFNQRKTLFDSLLDIDESISSLSDSRLVNILLYGNNSLYTPISNTLIINCTICFLKSSGRFDIPLM